MKSPKKLLRIFNFSHPLMVTESLALLGDKYVSALPFKISAVNNIQDSDIVLWDGVLTPKNKKMVNRMMESLSPSRLLIIMGESYTLLDENEVVKVYETREEKISSGWSLLPEDLLNVLLDCHKKLQNV